MSDRPSLLNTGSTSGLDMAARKHVGHVGPATGAKLERDSLAVSPPFSNERHAIVVEHPDGVTLTDLLRRGATAIFRDHKGFVESTSAYHFRNPSGRHTGRFIRLSNILVRQSEITFVALCALRHIPEDTTVVYVDTPSLFSLVAAVNDLRASENGLPPMLVDSFRSYDSVDTYAHFRIGAPSRSYPPRQVGSSQAG